ncbi:MAG: hypothetical protein ACJAZV_000208, partial [Roseivirga sp.]
SSVSTLALQPTKKKEHNDNPMIQFFFIINI